MSAAEAVDRLLEQLRAAPDVEAARVILRAEGHRIGGLDRALSAGLAGLRPAEVQLLQTVRDHVVGAATGEALSLCRWQIAGAQEPSETAKLWPAPCGIRLYLSADLRYVLFGRV